MILVFRALIVKNRILMLKLGYLSVRPSVCTSGPYIATSISGIDLKFRSGKSKSFRRLDQGLDYKIKRIEM